MASKHWSKLRQRILWTRQLVQRQHVQHDGWERIRANLAWRTVSQILTNRENENAKRFSYIWSRNSENVKTSADIRPTLPPEFVEFSRQSEHEYKQREAEQHKQRNAERCERLARPVDAKPVDVKPVDVTQFQPRQVIQTGKPRRHHLTRDEWLVDTLQDIPTNDIKAERFQRACRKVSAKVAWRENLPMRDARRLHWSEFVGLALVAYHKANKAGKPITEFRAAWRGYRAAIRELTEVGFKTCYKTRDYAEYCRQLSRIVRAMGFATKEQRLAFRRAYVKQSPFIGPKYLTSASVQTMGECKHLGQVKRQQRAKLLSVDDSAIGSKLVLMQDHFSTIANVEEARQFNKLLRKRGLKLYVDCRLSGMNDHATFSHIASITGRSVSSIRRDTLTKLEQCKAEFTSELRHLPKGNEVWQFIA